METSLDCDGLGRQHADLPTDTTPSRISLLSFPKVAEFFYLDVVEDLIMN
jgi:hypothetical protein